MSSGFWENEIRISKAAYPRRRCYFYAALFVDKLRIRKGERLEKWGEIVLKVYIFFAFPPPPLTFQNASCIMKRNAVVPCRRIGKPLPLC